MKNLFKLIYKSIKNSILCIRFPFLYPRNRFTGLHYNNWRVRDCCSKFIEKYKYNGKQDQDTKKVYNLKYLPNLNIAVLQKYYHELIHNLLKRLSYHYPFLFL